MTVNPAHITDASSYEAVKDWSQIGGMVLRAARRAMAVHLADAARELGQGTGIDTPLARNEQA